MTADALTIQKRTSTVEDLIDSLPMFSDMANNLFGQGVDLGAGKLGNLVQFLNLEGRIHRVYFGFSHQLRIGTRRLQDNIEATESRFIVQNDAS